MNREMLRQRLAQAGEHIVLGEHHIVRQQEIVAELERDGHDTAQARRILAIFKETQVVHIAVRDQLRRELDALDAADPPPPR
ncbi:hypothetical protein [Rhodopila globiformis]|uniref:Uncharacterized protein n=1 Tax=Rhodopila globiformis TaxID=1071 RepID=A0A2S6NI20_RHOGL|nr:hypothetical protein [Rhodopila globiformis]PPQ34243.1 hypothetical protein CCS01_11870 [Rhodopila globiformis]